MLAMTFGIGCPAFLTVSDNEPELVGDDDTEADDDIADDDTTSLDDDDDEELADGVLRVQFYLGEEIELDDIVGSVFLAYGHDCPLESDGSYNGSVSHVDIEFIDNVTITQLNMFSFPEHDEGSYQVWAWFSPDGSQAGIPSIGDRGSASTEQEPPYQADAPGCTPATIQAGDVSAIFLLITDPITSVY